MKLTIEFDDGRKQEFDNVSDACLCGVVLSPIEDTSTGKRPAHPFRTIQLGPCFQLLRGLVAEGERELTRAEAEGVAQQVFQRMMQQAEQARRIQREIVNNGGLRPQV